MCGKFTQKLSWAELHALYDALLPESGSKGFGEYGNDQEDTFAPMRSPRLLRLSKTDERKMALMRWR